MTLQPHIRRTLIQATLIAACITLSIAAGAQTFVTFTGDVRMPDKDLHPVRMTVSDGHETMDVVLGRNGAYSFHIPVNERVTLTLESPGHITKEVTIDTHGVPEASGLFARTVRVACTPSFHNSESERTMASARNVAHPGNLMHYVGYLDRWRDEGNFPGLTVNRT